MTSSADATDEVQRPTAAGGTAHNAGGGGGANGDSGSVWDGQGVMNNQVIGASSWTLDPGYAANGGRLTSSSGGGRGGYSYALNLIDPQSNGPDNSAWVETVDVRWEDLEGVHSNRILQVDSSLVVAEVEVIRMTFQAVLAVTLVE
jgi:hypothetical protein